MCIIIDANTLGRVFNQKSTEHEEFEPVLNWILNGRGKFVIGGSKYMREIGAKYLGLFSEFGKVNKAVKVDNQLVNDMEIWAAAQVNDIDFDDPHLVALLLVSKCKLICSLDKRAYPFFTHKTFFPPGIDKPKIYSRKSNSDLLIDGNIAAICKPVKKLTVKEREGLIN